jgi:hypothetical protein
MGWHLSQGESRFRSGWGFSWMGWHLAQDEGGSRSRWVFSWIGAAFSCGIKTFFKNTHKLHKLSCRKIVLM